MRRVSITLALSAFFLVSICSAQQTSPTAVPNLIRYGGTLKDASGAPIAAATGVTFAIYKQQDGGAPVWMETQNVTPDAGGNYSVLLGSTTATGLPSDLFSQEEQRWLGVQVQGQAEQPRVLLVSVPYAFKAHEAETLGGRSISDFVLAKDVNAANSTTGVTSTSGSTSTQAASGKTNAKSPSNLATAQGPTNFSGTTTDQIVSAVQSGTGKAIVASSSTGNAIVANTTSATTTTYAVSGTIPGAGVAILGHASSATAQGYGIEGMSDSSIGIGLLGFATATTGSTYGLKGYSSSTGGTGVRGLSTATTGFTTGISASVASPAGTAGVFNNTAGGKILSGQNNGAEKFSVDGSGNVNARGTFTGSGAGLTGIQFSQLVGSLASSQFSGSYSNVVTLSNTSNVYYGNGSNLTGVVGGGPGSPYYIQNGTAQQASANFNISGSGSANSFNSATAYQIGGSSVLSIGSPSDFNLFLGIAAGNVDVSGSGQYNVFSGFEAGQSNTTGSQNVFEGSWVGVSNTTGSTNTFIGAFAGENNTTGFANTFIGNAVGYSNTTGGANTFTGTSAGSANTTGSGNVFDGYEAGSRNTTGFGNSFSGAFAGEANTTGSDNTFSGATAGISNTSGGSNTFSGHSAGYWNTTGSQNTFSGDGAGTDNTTGNYNTFLGAVTGGGNTTGYYNTFVGIGSGVYNTSGSNDIYIGNQGPTSGTESNAIRIGTQGNGTGQQNLAYIAGIAGSTVTGVAVYVDTNTGQLGVTSSSRRFKEQIADMGDSSSRLFQLRPVTFFYKPQYDNGSHTLQYGLVAEEVAKVYPDLVAYDKDGQPYTVKYQYLAPMLLNELQKQHSVVAAQQGIIKTQEEQIQLLQGRNEEFQQRLSRLEALIGQQPARN